MIAQCPMFPRGVDSRRFSHLVLLNRILLRQPERQQGKQERDPSGSHTRSEPVGLLYKPRDDQHGGERDHQDRGRLGKRPERRSRFVSGNDRYKRKESRKALQTVFEQDEERRYGEQDRELGPKRECRQCAKHLERGKPEQDTKSGEFKPPEVSIGRAAE